MKKPVMFIFVLLTFIISSMTSYAYSIPNGYFITINKSNNVLTLSQNEVVIRRYPVATGASAELTPEGKFSIVCKVVNPSWGGGGYASPIDGGAPNNPLGRYWMGLSVGGGSTYGIHGTNNESSIGKYVSHGCIRMHNSDVESLFYTVGTGTPVWIGTRSVLSSYGVSDKLMGYNSNNNQYNTYESILVKINGTKMSQSGYVINGSTYIHWEALQILKINYTYLGNSKFKIGSRTVNGVVVNGHSYLNWASIAPNKLVPNKISGGFNFQYRR